MNLEGSKHQTKPVLICFAVKLQPALKGMVKGWIRRQGKEMRSSDVIHFFFKKNSKLFWKKKCW